MKPAVKPALPYANCIVSRERLDSHIDFELVLAATNDHPTERRDVGEIPPPGEGDMIFTHQAVIGRIEIHPPERRAIHGDPCVRGVAADRGFAPVAHGSDVAADVTRRQSRGAHTGDHQVREILADTAPALQDIYDGSPVGRGSRGIFEFAIDLARELLAGNSGWPAGHEAVLGVLFE